MSTIRSRHGFFDRPGLPPIEEDSGAGAAGGSPIHKTKSLLLDLFPEAWCIHWGVQELVVPVGSTVVAAGSSAFYGLLEVDPMAYFGCEGAIAGAYWEMLPCDHAAAVGAAWGNKWGQSAAIVLDDAIPSKLGEWTQGICNVPHVSGVALQQNVSYTTVKSFPSGALGDTVPVKFEGYQNFAGGVRRVHAGSLIKLAFALNRTQFNAVNAGGGTFAVKASGFLVFWPTRSPRPFTQ